MKKHNEKEPQPEVKLPETKPAVTHTPPGQDEPIVEHKHKEHHEIKVHKKDLVDHDVPFDIKETPPIPPTQNGGKSKKPKGLHPVHDFTSHSAVKDPTEADIPGEQTVDKFGKAAGHNAFYHGDHEPEDGNELVYQVPSELYELNKHRENR